MELALIGEVLNRFHQHGFQLTFTPAVAGTSPAELEMAAVKASAALLFNVEAAAFEHSGAWHSVGTHVRKEGLKNISGSAGELMGFNPVQTFSANTAIGFAAQILATVAQR